MRNNRTQKSKDSAKSNKSKLDIVGTKRVELRLKNLEVSDLIILAHKSGKNHSQIVNLIMQFVDLAKVGTCCETLANISRLNTIFDIAVHLKDSG